MSTDKDTTNVSIITDCAAGVPPQVKAGLLSAVCNLLGDLTSIPSAWLRRPAQAVNDTTDARSLAASILAKKVAEQALADPILMKAAAEIYLPTAVRKAANRVQVAQRASEHTAEQSDNGASGAAPNDDWMNAFVRFAEDASSERLQDLFGRILAGEIVRPGSFSLTTMRTVAELDQHIAEDFSRVWSKSVGDAVDYAPEFQRGELFATWRRLAEAGLMDVDSAVRFIPEYRPVDGEFALWTPMSAGDDFLNVFFRRGCNASWRYIAFTRVGRQLGSILAPPNYRENMRTASSRLRSHGVARIVLCSRSAMTPPVVLYHQTTT